MRANCASSDNDADFFLEHITHSGCQNGARIEHYGIEYHEQYRLDEVDGYTNIPVNDFKRFY